MANQTTGFLTEEELSMASKATFLKRSYEKYKIDFHYFSNDSEKKYLTDFITEDIILDWSNDCPVFISAQTGKGKNFFIQHTLLNLLKYRNVLFDMNKKILLLGNRIALNRQNKFELAELLKNLGYDEPAKRMEYYSDKGIDKFFIDLDIITVCSYQQFYENTTLQSQYFAYVICDECHFFTSDSTFYPYSSEVLNLITSKFQYSVRIYMSATLEESFVPIMESEIKNKINDDYDDDDNDDSQCIYYYFQRNYGYIKNIFAYDNFTQLEKLMATKKDSKDKWIVFVDSKKNGNKLLSEFLEDGIPTVFLTKDSKNPKGNATEYDTYQNIIKNEKFDQTVLISTAVLDNGINIKDETVKNIVVDILDRPQFLQMLGRVRITKDQNINLYIRNFSDKDIKKSLIYSLKELIARLELDLIPKNQLIDFYNSLMNQEELAYQLPKKNMFYVVPKKKNKSKFKIKYNDCAIFKLVDKISMLINIIKVKNPDFHVEPTSFAEYQTTRRKIIDLIISFPNYFPDYYNLRQILASEEELTSLHISDNHILEKSFLEYVYYRISSKLDESIRNIHHENSWRKIHNINTNYEQEHLKIQKLFPLINELSHYENILNVDNTEYPAIEQQLHWIERDDFEKIIFLDDKKNVCQKNNDTAYDDKEIYALLDSMSIPQDTYNKYSSKTENGISFKNHDILHNKGSRIEELTPDMEKFLMWLGIKNNCESKPRSIEQYTQQNPLVVAQLQYQLKIVKSTKKDDRHLYCLLVKSPVQKG